MKYAITFIFIMIINEFIVCQDKKVSDNQRPESEITATINPLFPNHQIVAAINDFDPGLGTQNSRLSIYYSSDFGDSWTKSEFLGLTEITQGINFIGDPVLSYDNQGVAYLVYIIWVQESGMVNTQIHLAQSRDNGQNWDTNQIVKSDDYIYDKPWIAIDNSNESSYQGSIYLSYVEGKSTSTRSNFDLKIHTKRKEAIDFSISTTINTIDFDIVQYPNISTNLDGQVFVSFVGNDGLSTYLYLARSDDGGNSFQPETRITDLRMYFNDFSVLGTIVNREGLDRLYPCPQMAIDKTQSEFQDKIYLTWTDKEENPLHYGLDVYLTFSTDEGETWSNPQIIHQNTQPFSHQYYSSIGIAPTGDLLLAWYDRKGDEKNVKTDYYYTKSIDGGQNFGGDIKLTSQSADFEKIGIKNSQFGIGEYTQMVSWGNKARIFWADGRRNNGDIKIYNAEIKVDESTIVEERELFPSISIYPNPVANILKVSGIQPNESVQISIHNTEGKVVFSNQYFSPSDHQYIDSRIFTPGIYILKIIQGNQIIGKKFIKAP